MNARCLIYSKKMIQNSTGAIQKYLCFTDIYYTKSVSSVCNKFLLISREKCIFSSVIMHSSYSINVLINHSKPNSIKFNDYNL